MIIDKWKKTVSNNKLSGALATDLSKPFDCTCHNLLDAKLHPYALSFPALKMVQDYLLNIFKKKKAKNGSLYSKKDNIIFGVPHGFILEPFLFKIFSCDLFLEHEGCCFTKYPDNATP